MELIDEIWKRIAKTEGCWPWKGAIDKNGYGLLRVNGKTARVARVFWKLLHAGVLPEGLHVLHRCDNPGCMRPDHLFLGTHKQNMADMAAKGRANRPTGELNGRALLTAAQVQDICRRHGAGESESALAREYKVSRGAICNATSGRSWQ